MHLDHLPGSFFGPSNLVDLLQHRALHQAQDRAFTYLVDGESEQVHLTNAQLDAPARMIAAKLVSMGLTGERALLLYPAGLDFIAAFFGCLYAGVVAVPAYPPRRNRSLSRIQAIVDDAQARVALTTAPVYERVGRVGSNARPEESGLGLDRRVAAGTGPGVAQARRSRRHAGFSAIHFRDRRGFPRA